MNSTEIMKLIRQHDDFLLLHGVKTVGLFGSHSRGEEREESDIDLIVEFEAGKKSYDNFIELNYFLEELLGRKVDLLTPESISPFMRSVIDKEVRYETIH